MLQAKFNKKFLVIKFFLAAGILLSGRANVGAQTTIAVAPAKMNVFYIGVDNPVNIAASDANDSKISVAISGGGSSITKLGNGHYIVRATTVTNECVITVSANGKVAGTSSFRVRQLPDVFATVGGHISGDSMPADEFKRQVAVGLSIKDFPFDIQFEIVSFMLTLDGNQDNIISANCQGSAFSSIARQAINQYIKPGSVVTIDEIRVKMPDNQERKIPGLVYYIK